MNRPEINLAHTTSQDSSAHYMDLKDSSKYDMFSDKNHICSLDGRPHQFDLSELEFGDMLAMGVDVMDAFTVSGYKIANIMGYHFKSGEWGNYPRCGSVITCVLGQTSPLGARSLFARVNRFFTVHGDDCPGYASVSWFSEPTYLYADNPLGVRCSIDGRVIAAEFGSVVRITQIDPTQIMVEPEPETDSYIMIRDSGYNTRRK